MRRILLLASTLLLSLSASAQRVDLSGNEWRIWLDESATYIDDELHLPPYDIASIKSNAPTCGWEALSKQSDIYTTSLPATVEQYAWGRNGNDRGVAGDYTGVSWFSTNIDIPSEWASRRIVLNFESARLRAEVYLNGELVGYEIINGTPFSVDISKSAKAGESNRLDVRITDPNGNFAWRDWDSFMWGNYEISPSHGFGGITGKVSMESTGESYIDDLYIKNCEKLDRVTAQVTVNATLGGELKLSVREAGSDKVLYSKIENVTPTDGVAILNREIVIKGAKAWTPETPNLYEMDVEWVASNGDKHSMSDRFGFRWFDVVNDKGDMIYTLNGKRVVLHTAISWGHWPVNGIYPTEEYARKHITSAKELGMNMLNFHRGIGQTNVFDLADELGLMIYEEPGGYKPGNSDFAKAFKREKLLRMVKRDRNHPSLVIVNMINESARDPFPNEIEDIQAAHAVDPTRCKTFTSSYFGKKLYNGMCPINPAPIKMHMLPNDTTVHYQGWWDQHHAGGPGVYRDEFYKSPSNFERYKAESDEIIFYGEEGAIGTLPRLQLIKEEIERSGEKGWNGEDMLRQYNAFDTFLKEKGFTESFADVDELCLSLGAVAYYYQGRLMENVRISNNIDGWATNGWESTKIENHSGIVDVYRNHKADPAIIAYYNQPHYVAVKARRKVLAQGAESVVDFHMVNQVNLKGSYKLRTYLESEAGEVSQEQIFNVKLSGGNTYGELLVEGVKFNATNDGYNTVKAELIKGKSVISQGEDKLFAPAQIKAQKEIFVADSAQVMQTVLKKAGIESTSIRVRDMVKRDGGTLVMGGAMQPDVVTGNFRQDDPLMEWVSRGGTLLILNGAADWCTYLEHKEVVDYRGSRILDRNWFGGNFFVKEHPLFEGLPQSTAFNWEYQGLASYARHREGLRLENGECVVGCYADHKNEVYSAVTILPVGKGKIIVSTLDVVGGAGNATVNRLMQNMVNY